MTIGALSFVLAAGAVIALCEITGPAGTGREHLSLLVLGLAVIGGHVGMAAGFLGALLRAMPAPPSRPPWQPADLVGPGDPGYW
jgi:hypothetical protein